MRKPERAISRSWIKPKSISGKEKFNGIFPKFVHGMFICSATDKI